MNLIRLSIERPIAIVAAVVMVLMFGFVALRTIPIQLAPDVRKPIINIRTDWFGAAPAEVEREILNRQEEVLKGLDGLEKIEGQAQTGRSEVTLEFAIGTNMDRALLLVANRLDRVNGYPEEADEPVLSTQGSDDNPIAWFLVRREAGNTTPIHHYGDFIEDVIQDRVERVPGVAGVNVYGGSERELQVVVKPEKMAQYGLTVTEVVGRLRAANASISGGDVDEGKRRYVVRTDGDLTSPEDVNKVVLRTGVDPVTGRVARVTVGDIAEVKFGYKEPTANIRFLGEPGIAFNAVREQGANVIATMDGIREAIAELNERFLPDQRLYIRQVYDETVYIDSSIELVTQNIWFGGVLAAVVLLLFLRSPRATLVVSLAIPISVVGSFVAMAALGRSLNVISLAGIAFSVGMVVDAAIVVLENIYRQRERGLPAGEAAYRGAQEVWGAVLVSALTTVCVFVPILIMELEVGQLFRDIAVAIAVAVCLSLLVAITFIPALCKYLLNTPIGKETKVRRLPIIDNLAGLFVAVFVRFTDWVVRRVGRSLLVAVGVAVICATATALLLPKLEYLPTGNRNLVFGIILPPPGYNLDTMTEIADRVESAVEPLWPEERRGEPGAFIEQRAEGARTDVDGKPAMSRFFFVALNSRTILGAAAADPTRVKELIPILESPLREEPGTFWIIQQRSLFGRGIGSGRSIDVDISGPDLEAILRVAGGAMGRVAQLLPRSEGNQFRPIPGLELGSPEVRVLPDRLRLADNGLSGRELGDTVDAFNDGLRVVEVTVDGQRMDLMLRGPERNILQTQGINSLPVVTSAGQIVPASSLAEVVLTAGPTQIRHLERVRTVTISITPNDRLPLQAVIEQVQESVVAPLVDGGLPPGVKIRVSGTADELSKTEEHMKWDMLLAVVIVYLVMAVLFESFVYPLIIMFSVPLATAGGFVGLEALNTFVVEQKLDMLTMLGFIILVGIVVNNAILLVHQGLYLVREVGMERAEAIREATRNRMRPIFMSTLTSVFGMAPLVVFPGAGSELYRGLGSVVLGGLSLSAVLTLLIIPPLMSIAFRLTGETAIAQPKNAPDDPGVVPEQSPAE